jgi:photosystem II stability/assembly factor-like uncharacterized protein
MSSYVNDTTAPSIGGCEVTHPTNDNTPDFIISSSEAGTVTYGGSCSSSTTSVTSGTNTVTYNTLSDGTYTDCTCRVTDSAGNVSNVLFFAFVLDSTAPTVSSIYPTDNQSGVSNTDNITVTFSEAMNTTYVTTSTSDTYCAGTIRVSSDNFSTCVKMSSSPASSNSNKTFTVDPSDNLSYSTTYKTRVTTGVKDIVGNTLSSQYETSSGFITADLTAPAFVAVGLSGNIVRSTDNGSSFDNATIDNSTTNHLIGVTFGNNTFVGVGFNGNIVKSTNNGSSWDNATSPTAGGIWGVTFGNNTFVASALDGNIVRSTDNGSSWDNTTSPTANDLNAVTFGNNTFVVVGYTGNIVRSTDNGSSFDNVTSPTANDLNAVTFGNNTFVAVGSAGNIVRSTDNGSSWDNVTSPTIYNLWGVTFGNNTFMAVGFSGTIVRSTDNGSSWDNATSPTSNTLRGVTFGNNTFVVVGYTGNIVRSTDNGSSWDNATSPTSNTLMGVTFSQ